MSNSKKYTSFIAGEFIAFDIENQRSIFNKFSNQKIADCSILELDNSNSKNKKSNLDMILKSTFASFESLKQLSAEKKSSNLMALYKKLSDKHEFFAQIISQEAGKPISYARAEIDRCLYTIKIGAEEARRITGEVICVDIANGIGKQAYSQLFPKGPILAIAPFNFPLNLALHKIIPAIACGCPIVIKPSPYTPLSILEFAKLIQETEIPAGSVNVIICTNHFCERLLRDDIFKTFSFTGSPKIGWQLKNIAGKKNVLLELGGNAAVIIDDQVDLKKAAKDCAVGAFLYSGQICISTQRILIKDNIYDEFKKIFLFEVNSLKVGDPKNDNTIVGPLIDDVHLNRMIHWINEAKEAGGIVLTGGKVLNRNHKLYEPTVLERVPVNCKVICEEAFGPVVVLEKFSDFNKVYHYINQSRFGLQIGVYTNRINIMKDAFKSLDVGAVLMNSVPGFRLDHMPYGGVKDSGLGREGIKYVIEEYCEKKLLIY